MSDLEISYGHRIVQLMREAAHGYFETAKEDREATKWGLANRMDEVGRVLIEAAEKVESILNYVPPLKG